MSFEVEVLPILYPQFSDAGIFQSLLFSLGVWLPEEVISGLNEISQSTRTSTENNIPFGKPEVHEDDMLSDCEDLKRIMN